MIDLDELGTTVGAVNGYVDMMSKIIGVGEERLHVWLDTYYQLRLAYERSLRPKPEDVPGSCQSTAPDPQTVATAETTADIPMEPSPELPKEKKSKALFTGNGARFKRAVYDRLIAARAAGLSTPVLRKLAGNLISDEEILRALQAGKLNNYKWEIIGDALDTWEADNNGAV